jgi:hypothetical protein
VHASRTLFFAANAAHAANTASAAIYVQNASLSSNLAINFAIRATVTTNSAYTAVAPLSTEIPCATDTTADRLVTNILAKSALLGMSL